MNKKFKRVTVAMVTAMSLLGSAVGMGAGAISAVQGKITASFDISNGAQTTAKHIGCALLSTTKMSFGGLHSVSQSSVAVEFWSACNEKFVVSGKLTTVITIPTGTIPTQTVSTPLGHISVRSTVANKRIAGSFSTV